MWCVKEVQTAHAADCLPVDSPQRCVSCKTLNQQSVIQLGEGGFTPMLSQQKQLATFTLNETFICQEML